jgi:NADH-quinone oxidoreductase subunit A
VAAKLAQNGPNPSAVVDNQIYFVGRIDDGGACVSEYLGVAIFAVFIVGFALVSLLAARLLRPARPDAVKLANYECGAEPIGSAWIRFPVGFYLVALVFIVFDALAVFVIPWTLVLRSLGMSAFWVMAGFIAIVMLGWLYAYREGVLEWK